MPWRLADVDLKIIVLVSLSYVHPQKCLLINQRVRAANSVESV